MKEIEKPSVFPNRDDNFTIGAANSELAIHALKHRGHRNLGHYAKNHWRLVDIWRFFVWPA